MSIFSIISNLFKPAAELIDNVHTSTEEKLKLRNELAKIESDLSVHILNFEKELMSNAKEQAIAETQSESWFTRTYRPMIVTGMFLLICLNAFGFLKIALPEIFMTIFGASFGIVSTSRGIEKVFKIRGGE